MTFTIQGNAFPKYTQYVRHSLGDSLVYGLYGPKILKQKQIAVYTRDLNLKLDVEHSPSQILNRALKQNNIHMFSPPAPLRHPVTLAKGETQGRHRA